MDVNSIVAVALGVVCSLSVGGVVIITATGHEPPTILGVIASSALTGLAAIWNATGKPAKQ